MFLSSFFGFIFICCENKLILIYINGLSWDTHTHTAFSSLWQRELLDHFAQQICPNLHGVKEDHLQVTRDLPEPCRHPKSLCFLFRTGNASPGDCVVVQLLSRFRLCDSMGCSTPGFSVLHHLLEFAQIHVH